MGGRPEIYNKLIKFENRDVPLTQIQVLTKLHAVIGRTLPSSKIRGVKDKGGKRILPPDDIVEESHYMHNLVTGVYNPASSDFAQCIVLNPKSRWDLEIDREHPTLKINYDFEDATTYKSQMSYLKRCYDIGLPVGILFRMKRNEYKALGLGKVTSISGTTFILESYGLSNETSASLKEATLSDYDKIHYGPDIEKIPHFDLAKFIRTFKQPTFVSRSYNRSIQINIPDLLERCKNGAWVIPNFQRFYDWDKNMVKNLLSSILYGYHIGSLLLWPLPKGSELGTTPVKGVKTLPDDLENCHIILDGQQRITSLYYAIKSPNFSLSGESAPSFFYIDFAEFFSNKPEETIKIFSKELEQQDCFRKLLFPFNQLDQSNRWIEGLSKFLVEYDSSLTLDGVVSFCSAVREKLDFIKAEFKISYITLEDMHFQDVINIFERINTTGKQLDAFDLLIARISSHGINLRKLWESACEEYPKISEYFDKPLGSTKGLTIFQSMALCYTQSRSCKHADILNIFGNSSRDREDFLDKWKRTLEYVDRAIAHLELISDNGFGVISRKWIPFEPMIPVIASLFWLIETKYENKLSSCYERLGYWYWISVFSNAYSSGANTQKTHDYNIMEEWFDTDIIPEHFKIFQNDFDHRLNLGHVKSTGSSIFRGILSLLTLASAKDWNTNTPVLNQKIFKKYKVNVDHVFPKSKYKNEPFNESILNKTWLYETTNKKLKRAKNPSTFINETMNRNFPNRNDFKKTMITHFVNEKALQALLDDEHESFAYERENVILQEIARRIGSPKTKFQSSVMPLSDIDTFSDDILGAS